MESGASAWLEEASQFMSSTPYAALSARLHGSFTLRSSRRQEHLAPNERFRGYCSRSLRHISIGYYHGCLLLKGAQ